jgi:hypothetical protein
MRLIPRIPNWLRPWRNPAGAGVRHRSRFQNIYHCTVQKSASQWVRRILSDRRILSFGALSHLALPDEVGRRKPIEQTFAEPFPERTILSPLYVSYERFAEIPKAPPYRAFFVMRDPRDVAVSWYFSAKFSHATHPEIERIRVQLQSWSESDGLLFAIDFLQAFGLFAAQLSWIDAPARDPNVLLTRYEDLTGPRQVPCFQQLLNHCDIRLPAAELVELLHENSFEQLSGRRRGEEDVNAHYRKGVAGDWRAHFDDRVHARFLEAAGETLSLWGYS